MLAAYITIAILVILAALVLAVSFFCYKIIFRFNYKERFYDDMPIPEVSVYYPYRDKMNPMMEAFLSDRYEEVYITSPDGKKLCAHYYEFKGGAPLFIFFHGYKSLPKYDITGFYSYCKMRGINLLAVYQRGCGKTKTTAVAFGELERKDAVSWSKWASEKFPGVNIYLTGISLGAATVLRSSELDPPNVKGIIAECGYTSCAEAVKNLMKAFNIPLVLYPFVGIAARIYGGFSIHGSCEEALSKSSIPLLIIHGEQDAVVPIEMSRRNYAASRSEIKHFISVPGAPHGLSYLIDPEGYTRAVDDFLSETYS